MTANTSSIYLFKLGAPPDEAGKVKRAAGFAGVPEEFRGADDADTTLPQHRSNGTDDPNNLPAQTQYPPWYPFYGTFVDPGVLGRLLRCDNPSYRLAKVHGGFLRTWGAKYKALVDAEDDKSEIQGQAFLVLTPDRRIVSGPSKAPATQSGGSLLAIPAIAISGRLVGVADIHGVFGSIDGQGGGRGVSSQR
ncbi:hypothetical protein DL770_000640 [Monosporascus sp. CRB-9-2]|nr:hypothetical protein DL770_000640 [Monosporascus sp. CRB-9-2]